MKTDATCPLLKRGVDFEAQGRWPCVMLHPVSGMMGHDLGAIFEFYSGERLLARHDKGRLTLMKGYACDSFSPVIRLPFGKFWHLTPWPVSGPWPAFGHDLTRQFLIVDGCPYKREDTDNWFYNWLTAGGVSPRKAGGYYVAVAGPAGDAFIRMTRKPDPNLRIVRTEYTSHEPLPQ